MAASASASAPLSILSSGVQLETSRHPPPPGGDEQTSSSSRRRRADLLLQEETRRVTRVKGARDHVDFV
ncbi:hypothetical protein NHX12_007773 [Muraenolepis orangiensis]|uniref:Uncharacterized protein n=1 Tax=Muraenolepis orangiensis TaxID=630683 RepID=A0A9Q0IDB7_9TELE|nr:hypothetical protein NHX12_007773 [Muraenolepis orangiensis]